MGWQKGMTKPLNSGIKKGQKQVKTLVRNSVKDFLLGINKYPPAEILKLIGQLEPRDQVKTWLELMKYVSPQLSAVQVTTDDLPEEDEAIDVTPLTNEELLEAIKGTTEGTK